MLDHIIFENELEREFSDHFGLTGEEFEKELNFVKELISGPLNGSDTANDNEVS